MTKSILALTAALGVVTALPVMAASDGTKFLGIQMERKASVGRPMDLSQSVDATDLSNATNLPELSFDTPDAGGDGMGQLSTAALILIAGGWIATRRRTDLVA